MGSVYDSFWFAYYRIDVHLDDPLCQMNESLYLKVEDKALTLSFVVLACIIVSYIIQSVMREHWWKKIYFPEYKMYHDAKYQNISVDHDDEEISFQKFQAYLNKTKNKSKQSSPTNSDGDDEYQDLIMNDVIMKTYKSKYSLRFKAREESWTKFILETKKILLDDSFSPKMYYGPKQPNCTPYISKFHATKNTNRSARRTLDFYDFEGSTVVRTVKLSPSEGNCGSIIIFYIYYYFLRWFTLANIQILMQKNKRNPSWNEDGSFNFYDVVQYDSKGINYDVHLPRFWAGDFLYYLQNRHSLLCGVFLDLYHPLSASTIRLLQSYTMLFAFLISCMARKYMTLNKVSNDVSHDEMTFQMLLIQLFCVTYVSYIFRIVVTFLLACPACMKRIDTKATGKPSSTKYCNILHLFVIRLKDYILGLGLLIGVALAWLMTTELLFSTATTMISAHANCDINLWRYLFLDWIYSLVFLYLIEYVACRVRFNIGQPYDLSISLPCSNFKIFLQRYSKWHAELIRTKCQVLLHLKGFSVVDNKLYHDGVKIDETVGDYISKIVVKKKVYNFLFFKINIEKFQHSTKFWNLPPEFSNLFDEESDPTRFANPVIELSDRKTKV